MNPSLCSACAPIQGQHAPAPCELPRQGLKPPCEYPFADAAHRVYQHGSHWIQRVNNSCNCVCKAFTVYSCLYCRRKRWMIYDGVPSSVSQRHRSVQLCQFSGASSSYCLHFPHRRATREPTCQRETIVGITSLCNVNFLFLIMLSRFYCWQSHYYVHVLIVNVFDLSNVSIVMWLHLYVIALLLIITVVWLKHMFKECKFCLHTSQLLIVRTTNRFWLTCHTEITVQYGFTTPLLCISDPGSQYLDVCAYKIPCWYVLLLLLIKMTSLRRVDYSI